MRRGLFREASVMAAGIVQPPGGLQVWLGQFFQTAVAGQAEQKIGVRIVERQLHQFHVGEMSITTQQDAGLGISRGNWRENRLTAKPQPLRIRLHNSTEPS